MTAYIEGQQKTVQHKDGTDGSVGYYKDKAPSRWLGKIGYGFGYGSGQVGTRDLVQMLDGITPKGEDISKRGNRQKDRRKCTDLTFSAPKSISIMALAAGDYRLIQAHAEAVAIASEYIQKEMLYARNGAGGCMSEFGVSVAIADFRHEDSRAINGVADPQLHNHLILPNMCQRKNGTWSAIKIDFGHDNEKLYTLDTIYKAELANRVVKIGYKIRDTKDGFEIADISDALMETFSRRRVAIDEKLVETGKTRETSTSKQRDNANLNTRGSKTQLSKEAQEDEWKERINGMNIENIKEKSETAKKTNTILTAEDAVQSAVRHLSESQTTFSKAELLKEALQAGMGSTTLKEVEQVIKESKAGLIEAGSAIGLKSEAFTSMELLLREASILKLVESGQRTKRALRDTENAQEFISQFEAKRSTERVFKFSEGQSKAVEHALTTRDRHIAIVGAAGAGKTTAMAAIVEDYNANGFEVIGVAPSAAAARELRSAGCETQTLSSILAKPKGNCGKPRLYVMDEAGMVGAEDFDKFLKLADIEDARSILVGDPRQLSAVGAGKPYAQMIETESVIATRIDEIQRQKANQKLLSMAMDFAQGESKLAVLKAKEFIAEVKLKKGDVRSEVLARRATEVFMDLTPDERVETLVLAGTNETRGMCNHMIRQELIKEQSVKDDGIAFAVLDKAKLTKEKATRTSSYEVGMVVQFEREYINAHGKIAEKKSQWEVIEAKSEGVLLKNRQNGAQLAWNPADPKSSVGVYTAREIELGTGDKVFFRQNDTSRGITNGTYATVIGVSDRHITLRLDDNRKINLDLKRSEVLDYAYAKTVHASQGATVDRVIVVGEASRTATVESAYVACTRERKDLTIITDDSEKLCNRWSKSADKKHAVDVAELKDGIPSNLTKARKEARKQVGEVGDIMRKIQKQKGIRL